MIRYVAGLLFSENGTRVALILKNHGPVGVIGRWNAVGGKRQWEDWSKPGTFHVGWANGYEPAHAAMTREFKEETGVTVDSWRSFLTLLGFVEGRPWEVEFFYAFDTSALACVRTVEKEVVRIHQLDKLYNVVPNLQWIIPAALAHRRGEVCVYEVTEKQ